METGDKHSITKDSLKEELDTISPNEPSEPSIILSKTFYISKLDAVLMLVSRDMWLTSNLKRETILSFVKNCDDEKDVLGAHSPIQITLESILRTMDPEAYIDGEFIDAVLFILCSFLAKEQESASGFADTIVLLPNQFINDSNIDNMTDWLPTCAQVSNVDYYVFAAHHINHWCAVVINMKKKQILYMDSCPEASTQESKENHKVLILKFVHKLVGTYTAASFTWMQSEEDLRDFFGFDIPKQTTAYDCGVFVFLYIWLCLKKITDEEAIISHMDGITKEEFELIRYFLMYFLWKFSCSHNVMDFISYNDSEKWINLGILAQSKLKDRYHKKLKSKRVITAQDKERYMRVCFPHTHNAIKLIKNQDNADVMLPPVVKYDTQQFKDFIDSVEKDDEEEYRDALVFMCNNDEGLSSVFKIMDEYSWNLNVTKRE